MASQKMGIVDCPNRECRTTHKIPINWHHFVWMKCKGCGKEFFANPKNKETAKKLKAYDSKPDNYILIHRNELDELVDIMLLWKDIDGAKAYTNIKISNPDVEWFVRKNDEEELYPLTNVKED